MAILATDIKLRESERMADTSDGGGRRTNRLIADGVAGNIFPKVSRVDSVYGRVNLRKVFAHVDTPGVDVYAGAHLVITAAPANDRIHVTAFSTASDFDNRTAARDRIESYVIAGPVSRMTLYGRQLYGAQALLVYQRDEEPLPEIGEVYAVSTEIGGVTSAQQFVRIQDVAHEVRTFTDESGEFKRRVVTLTISAPLRFEFNGPATPSRLSASGASGFVRSTTVADASRYFGLQPLSAAATAGDLSLSVASVYTPIVPTTQRESALNLLGISGANDVVPAALTHTPWVQVAAVPGVQEAGGSTNAHTRRIVLPRGAKRGSVQILMSLWQGITHEPTSVVIDDSQGVIGQTANNAYSFKLEGGVVDYVGGVIEVVVRNGNAWSAQVHCRYIPAAEVSHVAHTKEVPITLATRGTVYSVPLLPLPSPGALLTDYRSLGKWYRLRDTGASELTGGDAAYGTGTVDYVTGGTVITLGALPDVGSSLLLSWGSPAHYDIKTDDAGSTARLRLRLPDLPVKRASAVVTYHVNSTAHTATTGLQGNIGGDNSVTGTVNHLTGDVILDFGALPPDAGSVVSVSYQQVVPTVVGETVSVQGDFDALVDVALAGSPFDAGSVLVTATMLVVFAGYSGTVARGCRVTLTDDGLGHLLVPKDTVLAVDDAVSYASSLAIGQAASEAFKAAAATQVGTIDYATGAVHLSADQVVCIGKVYHPNIGAWITTNGTATIVNTESAHYACVATGPASSDSAKTHTVSLGTAVPLQIDLLRTTARSAVPGSVLFKFCGKTYFDRGGNIYTDVSYATGSGLVAGSIDYATGIVSLTDWTSGVTGALAVQALLTQYGTYTATEVTFRTPGSPIRAASLYLQATALDGTLLTATSDQNGIVTGVDVSGKIEQTMGVASIRFGSMVAAAGHEAEPWYDATAVIGGQIWRPRQILPSTVRYSAVVLSNLPLNADLLGLDPVRLPSDGRVPIFRPADVAVVHHTASVDAGTPAAGSTINVGRSGLAALWLEDANHLKLSNALYVTDLQAGTATLAADLNLTGYATPIAVRHRIEEMVLLSDVQINGTLGLAAPLQRSYPVGSVVSGALLFGDLFARVTGVFDQATWTEVWSNALIGAGATGQFNDIDHPIEVINAAAVSDRWRIHFTSTTAFQVISENMGVIATGTTSADLAPINPLTGLAYFTLRSAGWGLGWAPGNQLRFNTVAASPPAWLVRTVLPGATLAGDSFDAQVRGDVD